MSQIDNNGGVSNLNLTETPFCPRQTLEGKFKNCRFRHHDIFSNQLIAQRLYGVEMITTCPECNEDCRYQKSWATENEYFEYFQYMEKLLQEKEAFIEERKKNTKKHQSYDLGAREFTLTYSPKWMDDKTARMEMTKAMAKILKYYEDEIIELRAVGEVGNNGLSHIHCFYKLVGGLKITDKNFKRAWKYWNPKKRLGDGFEGGHHRNVKQESDFKGYIDKDIDDAWYEVTKRLASE